MKETREKKVGNAVMVPLIISRDSAIRRDSVRRWKDFASNIKVDRVLDCPDVLRYNVVIVRNYFKRSLVSDA